MSPFVLAVALLSFHVDSGVATVFSNLSRSWRPVLEESASDFDAAVTDGDGSCRPIPGRLAICSDAYGHGWLAIAQVWSSRGRTVQALVKLNDTYFGLARFDRPELKERVLRESLGKVFTGDAFDASANLPPAMTMIDLDGPGHWGALVEGSPAGRRSVYRLDFGDGNIVTTYVTWVPTSDESAIEAP